jgi:hypothetical protein
VPPPIVSTAAVVNQMGKSALELCDAACARHPTVETLLNPIFRASDKLDCVQGCTGPKGQLPTLHGSDGLSEDLTTVASAHRPATRRGRKVRFSGLRRCTMQELMGHKSISITLRYSHFSPKHTLATVELLAGSSTGASTDTQTSRGATEQKQEPGATTQ